jgi:hypothetical protein
MISGLRRRHWTVTRARVNVELMSRESVLLAALSEEPVSTSDLYTRIGYPTLVALGLVSYRGFRAELGKLASAGLSE